MSDSTREKLSAEMRALLARIKAMRESVALPRLTDRELRGLREWGRE